MQPILANYTASITELKKSPTGLLKDAGDEVVAILNHNVASAYLVPSGMYEKMMGIIDDYYLLKEVEERLKDDEKPLRVELDELLSWFSSKSLKRVENLNQSIKLQFHKKLKERLENPRVPKDKLSGYENIYKIKLRNSGFRLAYEVKDEQIVVLVLRKTKKYFQQEKLSW